MSWRTALLFSGFALSDLSLGTKGAVHAGNAGGLVLPSQAALEDHGAQADQAGGPRVQGRCDVAQALLRHGDGEPTAISPMVSKLLYFTVALRVPSCLLYRTPLACCIVPTWCLR